MTERAPQDDADAPALESPAFPRLVRILAVVIVVDLALAGLWSLSKLREADWSVSSAVVIALALLCVGWVGYWIVYSRTRLEGDVLTQTWLWNRRADASEVVQLKLVHWQPVEALIAPRLLVRRRFGSMAWFNSADARLLTGFAERVALRMARGPSSSRQASQDSAGPDADR